MHRARDKEAEQLHRPEPLVNPHLPRTASPSGDPPQLENAFRRCRKWIPYPATRIGMDASDHKRVYQDYPVQWVPWSEAVKSDLGLLMTSQQKPTCDYLQRAVSV